ncbi:MAG: ATP-binding cassette domain-containing protein [Flavobacteriales bacterium]|nr:ATP-binding cassette domain-containing protein [Flavobacteriales bacterium]
MKVISAERLSKAYFLKTEGDQEFHALKDISFDINEGETVGIIGHNGAGKSTLLKLLSGITLPTSGEAKVVGSFSSLLEVGTGFHPDLSGRDNIFLNASILSISRKEVLAEMQNIIAFSGVEKFIDQPLRTYSSGMKLRLAFSIIAHLKTDIITLDEVLAVGDSMFQVKCMERIFDFKQQGRTILFVSHNLSAVKKLCERTIVLRLGEIVFDGPTDEAIAFYLNSNSLTESFRESDFISNLTVSSTGKTGSITLELSNIPSDTAIDLGINISTQDGMPLYHFSNRFIDKSLVPENGALQLELTFDHQLKAGNYNVAIYIGQDEQPFLWQENAATLTVAPFAPYGFHNPDAIQASIITDFDINQL